jgi:hypothetical protein
MMNEPLHSGGELLFETLYENSIKPLPIAARLQLATRILNDIPPQALVDFRMDWSDEDQSDVTAYSLLRAAASFGEEDDA